MTPDDGDADENLRIERLLDDPRHRGHPLHDALARLYQRHRDQTRTLERVVHISDSYQLHLRQEHLSSIDHYRKHLRRLEKILRISDRYQGAMRERNAVLRDASLRDTLTGLSNRRGIAEWFAEEAARANAGTCSPFSVVLLDIDHFKRVNDSHGHEAGDRVLSGLSRLLSAELRAGDLCGRWGGEEFVLLLRDTSIDDAVQTVGRVRECIAGAGFTLADGTQVAVTASFGICQYRLDETSLECFARADDALMRAKREGRNRQVVDDVPLPPPDGNA
jgi:diguanylate cyclase (GGDEF)-like protein